MKTEELLEKYFDGQTTCEEERALRRFFASNRVPEHLDVYRPLFICIDREAETFRQTQKEETAPAKQPEAAPKPTRLYRLYYLTTGIAASRHDRPYRLRHHRRTLLRRPSTGTSQGTGGSTERELHR